MDEVLTARREFIKTLTRGFLIFVVVAACLAPQGLSQERNQEAPQPGKRQDKAPARKGASAIPAEIRAALDRVSVDSLRGHLSFLASDLLEGRKTPSRGLDIAAEYIAAQFRRIGLEPIGDDGYFQTAAIASRQQNPKSFEMTVNGAERTIHVEAAQTAFLNEKLLALENAPIAIAPEEPAGKVVLVLPRTRPKLDGAALALYVVPAAPPGALFDPEVASKQPRGWIFSEELVDFVKNTTDARVSMHVEPAMETRSKVRNVAGV